MKNIVSGLAASAIIASLWLACTVSVDDGGTGGSGGTSTTEIGGSAGLGGTSGTGGTTTGTGGGTGGTGGGSLSACESCAARNCGAELSACRGNADCAGEVDMFFACLMTAATPDDMMGCEGDFATQTGPSGQEAVNDLGTCLRDNDAGQDCEAICLSPDGG